MGLLSAYCKIKNITCKLKLRQKMHFVTKLYYYCNPMDIYPNIITIYSACNKIQYFIKAYV